MPLERSTLLVTMQADPASREIITSVIGELAKIVYLDDVADAERGTTFGLATAVLSRNTAKELRDDEAEQLRGARLIQYVSAGIDFIPLGVFPETTMIAGNGGGYAEPMAEHAVMMTLAAYKRLMVEHNQLAIGEFNQFKRNRMLAGSVCGVLGFGGIGIETARLMRALGVKVHAINRSGQTDQEVDWIGDTSQTDELLKNSDILVLSLPLTPATQEMIGERELQMMKDDAVVINLARGEIIDEEALYEHLKATPAFTACIDAWWVEPVRHGRFEMSYPFLELDNVIASPHNSASVGRWRPIALRRAAENVARLFRGEDVLFQVPPGDRMM